MCSPQFRQIPDAPGRHTALCPKDGDQFLRHSGRDSGPDAAHFMCSGHNCVKLARGHENTGA